MKNNLLDDIIKCNIEISNPTTSDVSFDKILIVVEKASASSRKQMTETVIEISNADELLEYGYKTTEGAVK